MHPYTFPKGTDLIVAMATAPDPDARFGSIATELRCPGYVCFALKLGHCSVQPASLKGANSSHGTHPELEAMVAEQSATDVA